jgi:hypothetical protein
MSIRKIPTSVHGVVDYVTAGTLMAAPDIFRMRQLSPAAIAPRVNGAAAAAYSALTDYELGLERVIPMKVHLTLDGVSGGLLAALPWATGSAKEGKRYWLPHALVGAMEIVFALTTKTSPPRTKTGKLASLVNGRVNARRLLPV